MGAGFVYLIECGPFYKIGKSKDPEKRLLGMTTLPYKMKLLKAIPVDDMAKHEKDMHRVFKEKRIRGEWFVLSAEDVEWFCSIPYMDVEEERLYREYENAPEGSAEANAAFERYATRVQDRRRGRSHGGAKDVPAVEGGEAGGVSVAVSGGGASVSGVEAAQRCFQWSEAE